MSNPDPIAPIVKALSVLVTPNPPTDGPLFVPVQVLLGIVLGASDDLTAVANGINTALTDLGSVIGTIGTELSSLTAVESEITGVFTALQTVLSLAQALAPAGSTGVLQLASGLFDQLQSLIGALGSIATAVTELTELSQQLTAAAALFPAS